MNTKNHFLDEDDEDATFHDVYDVFGPRFHPRLHKKLLQTTFCGAGWSKMSPAGQPGRQGRPVGLAGRWASLAAHEPAGCDLQVLQLAVGSGRGGEGGGQTTAPPPTPITAGGLFGI